MPKETRSFIEGECLRVARLQPGCEHLKEIAIARKHNGSSNWEVLGFNPELPSAVRAQAIEAIEIIKGQYDLAPFVKPSRNGQKI
jgi:hypothetical protein